MDKQAVERLSRPATKVYMSMEDELLKNIGRTIGKHKSLLTEIDIDGKPEEIRRWQAVMLSEQQELNDRQLRTIKKYSGESVVTVKKSVEDAGFRSVNDIEDVLQDASKRGLVPNEPPPIKESGGLSRIAQTITDNAKQQYNLVNTTLLDQSEQAYLDIINRTSSNVIAGIDTPQTALRKVASEWAETGVPALIDKGGKKWSTEAYVSMINRTAVNTCANEMQDERMREYGQDLFEVSSHSGSRPKCAEDEGQIYSMSGESDKYKSFSETSYGDPDGLFGINCGHLKFPFIEGISKKTYEPDKTEAEKEANKQAYKESQQQRQIERDIRKSKREAEMLELSGDIEGAELAKEKVRSGQAGMREFTKTTGRTRNRDREQIV